MKQFFFILFVYSAYMVGLATIVLGTATIFIPITDGVLNSRIMGVVLIILGLQVFVVTRKILDN